MKKKYFEWLGGGGDDQNSGEINLYITCYILIMLPINWCEIKLLCVQEVHLHKVSRYKMGQDVLDIQYTHGGVKIAISRFDKLSAPMLAVL